MKNCDYDIDWDDMDSGDYQDYYGGPDDWELEDREGFESGECGLPPRKFAPDEIPTEFVTDREHFYEDDGMSEVAMKVVTEFVQEHLTIQNSGGGHAGHDDEFPF